MSHIREILPARSMHLRKFAELNAAQEKKSINMCISEALDIFSPNKEHRVKVPIGRTLKPPEKRIQNYLLQAYFLNIEKTEQLELAEFIKKSKTFHRYLKENEKFMEQNDFNQNHIIQAVNGFFAQKYINHQVPQGLIPDFQSKEDTTTKAPELIPERILHLEELLSFQKVNETELIDEDPFVLADFLDYVPPESDLFIVSGLYRKSKEIIRAYSYVEHSGNPIIPHRITGTIVEASYKRISSEEKQLFSKIISSFANLGTITTTPKFIETVISTIANVDDLLKFRRMEPIIPATVPMLHEFLRF